MLYNFIYYMYIYIYIYFFYTKYENEYVYTCVHAYIDAHTHLRACVIVSKIYGYNRDAIIGK